MTFVTLSEAAKRQSRPHPRMYEAHGDRLDRILYRTKQWSVTEYGVENHLGPYLYSIPWADIRPTPEGEYGWERHMADKTWVDADSFNDAFRYAVFMKTRGYTPPKHGTGGDTQ